MPMSDLQLYPQKPLNLYCGFFKKVACTFPLQENHGKNQYQTLFKLNSTLSFALMMRKKSKGTVENLAFGFSRMVIRVCVSSPFNNQVLKK